MASSSSGTSFRASGRHNKWFEELRCSCDEPATFSISGSDSNQGRSIRGFPNFKVNFVHGFLFWGLFFRDLQIYSLDLQDNSKKCRFLFGLIHHCQTIPA